MEILSDKLTAIQFNGLDDYNRIFKWMWDEGNTYALAGEVQYRHPILLLPGPKGTMAASPGDYVVRDENEGGNFFVCRPDEFARLTQPMTDDQLSVLEQLRSYDPVSAEAVEEFHRLAKSTKNEAAKTILNYLVSGFLSTVDQEFTPWLTPFDKPGDNAGVIKGYGNVGDIAYVKVDGEKYGVWYTNNFIYRLRFLMTGRLAVGYPVSVFAHCIRLDVEEMGIIINEG
ncbi:hypothetical protein [Larkinella sp. C7]|uniref:hypothetical protein n=1 Tax=Larkinella sp. C7 TaxID=2576607 RepID=UPI00111128E3|nr:hypothetical protein [Larkinella sp. C7]